MPDSNILDGPLLSDVAKVITIQLCSRSKPDLYSTGAAVKESTIARRLFERAKKTHFFYMPFFSLGGSGPYVQLCGSR
jgi:hypothetical protein